MEVDKPFFEKKKSELVKIELHVPRATYGNYEKLRQRLKHKDVETTITRVMQQKIRQVLGRHYVPIQKDIYVILDAMARKKGIDLEDLVTEILKAEAK